MTEFSNIEKLKNDFFNLESYDQLLNFGQQLDENDPHSRAFKFLSSASIERMKLDCSEIFQPGHYLSSDLSAAIIFKYPVVFMGTNDWATKPYIDFDDNLKRIQLASKKIHEIREYFPNKKILCAIVPEKDYVIGSHFTDLKRFEYIDQAISNLKKICNELEIGFCYNEYLKSLANYEKVADFEYPDTHLPPRHYTQIFAQLLKLIGLNWQELSPEFSITEKILYGDLAQKFTSASNGPWSSHMHTVPNEQLEVVAGKPTYGEPLGSTWQSITNYRPLDSRKILILGDSHSSIMAEHRLTYLFAATFERCDFFWNPLGLRDEIQQTDADVVVLEMSQRFLV